MSAIQVRHSRATLNNVVFPQQGSSSIPWQSLDQTRSIDMYSISICMTWCCLIKVSVLSHSAPLRVGHKQLAHRVRPLLACMTKFAFGERPSL